MSHNHPRNIEYGGPFEPDDSAEDWFNSALILTLGSEGWRITPQPDILFTGVIKDKIRGTRPDNLCIPPAPNSNKRILVEIMGSNHFNRSKHRQRRIMDQVVESDKNVEYVQFSRPILMYLDVCLEIVRQLGFGQIDTHRARQYVGFLISHPDELRRQNRN